MGSNEVWVRDTFHRCFGKKAYSTIPLARKVATKVFQERGIKLYCYWCKVCGHYHLTKRLPRTVEEERGRVF